MIKKIHSILDELDYTHYYEQERPYNFAEACLFISGLAVVVAALFVVVGLVIV